MDRRNEYPRPDFVRDQWMSLNGEWDFYVKEEKRRIQVPFVCQSLLSGIGERIKEDRVVYERTFRVPAEWKGRQIRLNFGAVDYSCQVYVNGCFVGGHKGGHTPFGFDVTDVLSWEEERIKVCVTDSLEDEKIARGKQFWQEKSEVIWYTPSTGIWQSVWLEPVEKTSFQWIHFTPDIDEGTVQIDYGLSEEAVLPCRTQILITKDGQDVFRGFVDCREKEQTITVDIFRKKALTGFYHFAKDCWSPENPRLYDVVMKVEAQGGTEDEVRSYFGMRKLEIKEGRLYLNHRPYYQRLVLDQGYWKESLITAPSDQAYIDDIQKAKAMGFNGCRKHEKVEDPRFLYWADRLGFLVWEAMASFWVYTPDAAAAFMKEWMDVIHRDYNHPSIVVWGMLNESWGVPAIGHDRQHQAFAKALYHLAHSLDTTRPVVSNDGWEMTDSDICAVHTYRHGREGDIKQQELFRQGLKSVEGLHTIMEKPVYARGTRYEGQPVVLSEFGGISVSDEDEGWGYTSVDKAGFLKVLGRVVADVYDSEIICGFCYTQLTDVEQEVNGLLTADHQFKFDPEDIKKIIDM